MAAVFRRLRSVIEIVGGRHSVVDLAPALERVGQAVAKQIRAVIRQAADEEHQKPYQPHKQPESESATKRRHHDERNEMSDKNKQEVSFEGALPVDRIVSYLRELADGFEKGEVPVERGLERVTLVPAASIDIEVKAKVKKRKHQLRLEMEWEEPERTEELKIG